MNPKVLVLLVVIIAFGFVVYLFMTKKILHKEKFAMKVHRPKKMTLTSVPVGTWDPASMLTATAPSAAGPVLVLEKENPRITIG